MTPKEYSSKKYFVANVNILFSALLMVLVKFGICIGYVL